MKLAFFSFQDYVSFDIGWGSFVFEKSALIANGNLVNRHELRFELISYILLDYESYNNVNLTSEGM